MIISSATSKSTISTPSDGALSSAQLAPVEKSPVAISAKTVETTFEAKQPSNDRVDQAVKKVNDAFNQKGQSLRVLVERDDATKIDVIKLQDKDTKEVISQFPSKTIIAMAEAIDQSLDEKGQLLYVEA